MAGIGGLMGMGGGASGSGFAAPTDNTPQLNHAYDQTQSGIQQQQNFVNQLNAQNGLTNQNQVFMQQQNLANQLQGVANGTGPNPALAQLNQTTGQNVANQAALMAGQRGSSANTGLIARQAANTGANLQQQAVGQGATLQAQQQLAAMQQLQGQQANMGNMANSQITQQQAGLTALNQNGLQQQANLMGLQSNINSANAGLAGASQGAQSNMMGNMMGGIGSAMNMFGGGDEADDVTEGFGGVSEGMDATGGLGEAGEIGSDLMVAAKGGKVPQKMADGGMPAAPAFDPLMQASAPQATIAAPKTDGPSSKVGQMFNNYTERSAAPAPAKKGGGAGDMMGGMSNMAGTAMKGLTSWGEKEALPYIGDFFGGMFSSLGTSGELMAGGAGDAITGAGASDALLPALGEGVEVAGPGLAAEVAVAAKGGKVPGKVPALLSPGEKYLNPAQAQAAKDGKVDPMKAGKTVPGKPKVGGAKNSYANDFVKASLDEGGLVLPRSVTQSKNPEWAAHKFVRAHMMAQGGMIKKPKGSK